MLRSYKYRLDPTLRQERVLMAWLNDTRELYNAALQERRDAWRRARVRVTAYDQMAVLPAIRQVRPEFGRIPIVVQRGALRRLDRAFQAFFRRCKAGEQPGYPRFKNRDRWNSLLIDDLGKKSPVVAGAGRVRIPKLGLVKVNFHRPLEGTAKAMRIKRDHAGRWWVTFHCADVPERRLAPTSCEVGVDLGLTHLVATSEGELVENPRPLRAAELALARAQRIVSKRKKRSHRRRKAVRLLAGRHERVRNIRREHHIQVARKLVAENDVIYVEALNVKGLASGMLAKSVNDAGWGSFLHWLRTKAEEAGREVVEVDPRGTSQECPACGRMEAKTLSERVHRCPCGCEMDRDVAAATVILRRGQRLRRGALGSGTPMTREARVTASSEAVA